MLVKLRFDRLVLSGVICRCTGGVYPEPRRVKPIAAVLTAAAELRNAKGGAAA